MQRERKKYEDLTITDDFMFGKVMHHPDTGELEEAVTAAREHREWRREYMKLEAMTQRIRWEGRTEKLVAQIYRKAVKGKPPEEIAEDLEEELSEVRRIYDVVVKYLPDYDPEKILAELKGV